MKKINISAARKKCAVAFLRVIVGNQKLIVRNGKAVYVAAQKKHS